MTECTEAYEREKSEVYDWVPELFRDYKDELSLEQLRILDHVLS